MVLTASKQVADSMQKGRFVMTQCLDEGVLRLAGFLPLDVFLKWFAMDPTKVGVLPKTHQIVKQHEAYR